jgi:hypothetical protein
MATAREIERGRRELEGRAGIGCEIEGGRESDAKSSGKRLDLA